MSKEENVKQKMLQDYHEVLDDIGGCMHDTVFFPEIAKNFSSMPEQLLDRIKKLESN